MAKSTKRRRFVERSYSIAVPLYDWARISLVISSDVDRSSEKRDSKPNDPAVARTFFEGKGLFTVIIQPTVSAGVIAHEATHVAMQILHLSGVRFTICTSDGMSTKNDEPLAYLVGWIVEWICSKALKASIRSCSRPRTCSRGR